MNQFVEYRNLEKSKNISDFIQYYEENGIEKLICVVKHTGITINPYNSKLRYEKLISQLSEYLKSNKNDYLLWSNLINESNYINNIYIEFYKSNDYITANEILSNEEITAFILVLEKYLYYLSNIIQNNEKDNRKLNFHFDIKLTDDSQIKISESNINKLQIYAKIFDKCTLIADDVMKFLIFFKHKDKEQKFSKKAEFESISKSFFHLSNVNVKEIIDDIVEAWKFNARSIDINDNNVVCKYTGNLALNHCVIMNRLNNRRQTMSTDIETFISPNELSSLINEESSDLNEYISKSELIARLYLSDIFATTNIIDYKCKIRKNEKEYSISIVVLVRAFAVLMKMTSEFVMTFQNINSCDLSDVCLVLNEEQIIERFVKAGINDDISKLIINLITYSYEKDLFDNPLISYNECFILIPSIVMNTDIAQVILSIGEQFDFRGKLFEEEIINILKKCEIECCSKYYKDSSGEYQCDVLFVLNRDLYICECKAWTEIRSMKSLYNQIAKQNDAVKQLKRITTKYISNINILEKDFNMIKPFRNIHSIVILANAIGINNFIDDTYFVDYSGFSRFILRQKPTINITNKGRTYKFVLNTFHEYEGRVTPNKLDKYLKEPTQVEFTTKRIVCTSRELLVGNISICYQNHEIDEQFYQDALSMNDEKLSRIKKLYKLKK